MIDENQVELAERYAKALETISHLEGEQSWNESDVEQAEGYLATLQSLENFETTWNSSSVETANEYLTTLQEIENKKQL